MKGHEIGQGKVCIVANDNTNLLSTISNNMIDRFGFKVLKAETLDQADVLIENNPNVALIVLDNSIPRFPGDDLGEEERNYGALHARNLKQPIVLVTGGSIPVARENMLSVSARDAMGARTNAISPFNSAVRVHMAKVNHIDPDPEDTRRMEEYYGSLQDRDVKSWRTIEDSRKESAQVNGHD